MNKKIKLDADINIGLALSGGGVRAMAYHAGVLKWLADVNLLKSVRHISSVSGGSLFIGLVFHYSGNRWPDPISYKQSVYPKISSLLTSVSLQKHALKNLLINPMNWRFLLSRANVLSCSIQKLWGIESRLGDLPGDPIWSINGTTAENGRRFRFKGSTFGDYDIGYANCDSFSLASALAVSAAFPGGIGPLSIKTDSYKWEKRSSWDTKRPPKPTKIPYKNLHLYDGGVYDNLGLEPLFDLASQKIQRQSNGEVDFVILSNAGSPLNRGGIPGPLHILRLKKVADVMFEQVQALRVRTFINFLRDNPQSGMCLQIGSVPEEKIQLLSKATGNSDEEILSKEWLPQQAVNDAKNVKTSLNQLSINDFDLLSRHGFETARWNDLMFYGFE